MSSTSWQLPGTSDKILIEKAHESLHAWVLRILEARMGGSLGGKLDIILSREQSVGQIR